MAEEITVTRVDRAPPAELQAAVHELMHCGYELAGTFEIPEIAGVELVGLANADSQTYAVVGQHDSGLKWIDVVTELDDGRWLTVSNNATAGALGTVPGHDKIFLDATATGTALHQRAIAEPTNGRRAVSTEQFADALQRSYASEAAARSEAGVRLDDLRGAGLDVVSDEVATTQAILDAQRALETLQHAVQSGDNPLAAFGEVMEALSQGTLSDPEDDPATVALAETLGIGAAELADKAVVISADLDEDDVVWAWDSAMEMAAIPVSASQPVMHALITGELEGDPIELAAAANARLPERYRLRVTARVTEPVLAVAYQPIARAVPADPRPDEARIAEIFARWRATVEDADLPPAQLQCRVERGLPTASIAVPGVDAVRIWEALRERTGAGFWPVIRGAGPIPSTPEDGPGASTWLEHAQQLDTDEWLLLAADIDAALRDEDEDEDEDYDEDDADDVEPSHELTIPLDIMTGEPLPTVMISLVPTNRSWEVPAYLHFGGFSDCPPPEVLVAMLKRWHERFGAEVVGMTHEAMELRVTRPVRELADAEPIAREQYLVCNDIVDEGTETVLRLARQCVGSTTWYFWWD